MARRSPTSPGSDPKTHPALTGGHVVVISGEKPIYKQNMQGPQGHAALGHLLEQKGFEWEPTSGKYNGEAQPAYIVYPRNDSEDESLKSIAKRFGQEYIVHSEGRQHQLIYTGGPDEGRATQPAEGVNHYESEPDDNYSTIYGPSGEPQHFFSYALDFDKPLIQHGPAQTVSAPQVAQAVMKSAVEAYRGILLDLRKREDDKLAAQEKPPVCGCGVKGTKRGSDWVCTNEQCGSHNQVLRTVKKYQVETGSEGQVTHGPKPLSDDISAQGSRMPSLPYSGNVVTTLANKKSEADEYWGTPMKLHELMKAQALSKPPVSESQRRLVHARAAQGEGWAKEWASEDKPGKLPETKKAQCTCGLKGCKWCGSGTKPKPNEQGEHGGGPKQSDDMSAPRRSGPGPVEKGEMGPGTPNNPAREGSQVNVANAGQKPSWKPMGTAMKAEFNPTPNLLPVRDQHTGSHPDGSSLSPNKPSHPFSEPARSATGGSMVVKNSIFKRMSDMSKSEKVGSAGTIKLGKQEFVISRSHQSDAKKRLVETNPVAEAVVPGGKETGWQTAGVKSKVLEHSASGGAISANKPKAGPDQKNTSENSVTEGNPGKRTAPKNDLIEKASEDFHKRTGGRFQKKPADIEKAEGSETSPKKETSTKPEASASAGCKRCGGWGQRDGCVDCGVKYVRKSDLLSKAADAYYARVGKETVFASLHKAATSMAAPKTPSAPGAGSPTLSAGAPAKPPATPAGGKPMGGFGKALMPFSAANAAMRSAQTPPPAAAPEAKAVPKDPSQYDPSLWAPPAGGVKSGLFTSTEMNQPPPGTGVHPGPAMKVPAGLRSPAMHRGITGFMGSMGKSELCKGCNKVHKSGQCG